MRKKLLLFPLILLLIFTLVLGGCSKGTNENGDDETTDTKTVGAFNLVSPEADEKDVDTQPTLEWGISKNAIKYSLTISKNEDFSGDANYIKNNIASPYHTINDFILDYSAKYYWKVEAVGVGEGNLLLAANSPLSFSTINDTNIELNIDNLSYISGDNISLNYTIPTVATEPIVQFSTSAEFATSDIVYSCSLTNGIADIAKTLIGNGTFYIKVSATIDEETYYSESEKIFIGNNILIHNFSAENAGISGNNSGIRNWTDGTQLEYALSNESLKITYDIASYADYVMVDFTTDATVISDIRSSTYVYLRYKASAYIGAVMLKMRGDNSVSNNWKDYTIGDVQGTSEWQESLIEINTSGVVNLNRLSFAIMSSIAGEIYIDDIYFIKTI